MSAIFKWFTEKNTHVRNIKQVRQNVKVIELSVGDTQMFNVLFFQHSCTFEMCHNKKLALC